MASNHPEAKSQTIPLAQLMQIDDAADLWRIRELRDAAQFIAHASRISRRALRFNADEVKRLHGNVHPSTVSAAAFLQGIAQEFESVMCAASARLRALKATG